MAYVFKVVSMKDQTPMEFGIKLQQDIVNALESIGIKASHTNGSGNKGSAGDVNNPLFVIECKARNTKDITIKADVWKKLCNEIPMHSKRKPLYVIRNEEGTTLVCMNLTDFTDLLNQGE